MKGSKYIACFVGVRDRGSSFVATNLAATSYLFLRLLGLIGWTDFEAYKFCLMAPIAGLFAKLLRRNCRTQGRYKMSAETLEDLEADLTEEDKEFLDRLASGLIERRLGPAAVFFLESMKPMGYIASQTLHFLRPMIQTLWSSPIAYDRVGRLLERRGTIELLIRRLEASL